MIIRLEGNEWSVLDRDGHPLAVVWQTREGDTAVWRAGPAIGARGRGVEHADFYRVAEHCFKTMKRHA
jgi:hypothetical protein